MLDHGVGDEPERAAVAGTALARPERARLARGVLDVERELVLGYRAEILVRVARIAQERI